MTIPSLVFSVGYWTGVIWMPLFGYLFGEMVESLLTRPKKPTTGRLIGLVIGLVFWLVVILPKLVPFF